MDNNQILLNIKGLGITVLYTMTEEINAETFDTVIKLLSRLDKDGNPSLDFEQIDNFIGSMFHVECSERWDNLPTINI